MPMTKEQFEEIKTLVASRDPSQIAQAKRKLRTIDDDRAQKMLTSLEEKYPTPARERVTSTKTGPAKTAAADDLAEVKSLIAQKKYDEAEALLWASDAPEAADLLKKLTLVRSVQPGAAKVAGSSAAAPLSGFQVKTKEKPQSSKAPILLASVVAICLVLVIGIAALAYSQRDTRTLTQKIEDQLIHVCFFASLRVEGVVEAHLTDDQTIRACTGEVDYVISMYPVAMTKCYEQAGEDEVAWLNCMSDEESIFSMQYFIREINR